MATQFREAGEFCWINILTPRPAEAMDFFASVLGWTFFEMPGLGHGMRVDGSDIGGLFDLDSPNTPPAARAHIGVMVRVENLDEITARVVTLGGTVPTTLDLGEPGRMAVCIDPLGAKLDLWEPRKMLGTDADRSRHGVPSWSEALTTDVPRATAFYTDLFGWTAEVKSMPGMDYTVFKRRGSDVAGLMPIPAEGIPPHWGTYFTVDDVDEAARVAAEMGGTVWLPPMEIPTIGRFTGIISPQGIRFYAIAYLPRAAA